MVVANLDSRWFDRPCEENRDNSRLTVVRRDDIQHVIGYVTSSCQLALCHACHVSILRSPWKIYVANPPPFVPAAKDTTGCFEHLEDWGRKCHAAGHASTGQAGK